MRRVLFDFGDWEMTSREIIFGLLLFAIYIIGGFCIYEVIDRKIENHNAKYNAAVWVTDDDTFKNRLYSDSRDAFIYGKWNSVGYVTFEELKKKNQEDVPSNVKCPEGKFAYVSIEKEHYTRHTRVVAHVTTVNGKTQTVYKTEVYYSWDKIWEDSKKVERIKFAGAVFPYGTVKPNKIYKYLGTDTHGNDRYVFNAELTEASGITFTHIENNEIEKCTLHQEYSNTSEDFKKFLDDKLMGNGLRYAFWIVFVFVGVFGVVVFCVLDNDWLNNI